MLKEPAAATTFPSSTSEIRSFVVVFPEEPVTPITVAVKTSRRYQAAISPNARTGSLTTMQG